MTKRLFAVVLAAGLVAPILNAPSYANEEEHHGGHDMAEGKEGKWKEKLGLSEEQAAKLQAARKERQDTVKPIHDQLKLSMDRLREQVKNNASDGDIKVTLDQIQSSHKTLQAANEKFKAEMDSILTPMQRAKMMVGMHGKMKDRKKGDHKRKE